MDVVDPSDQPSKAELEENPEIDTTLEALGKAVTRTVKVRYVKPQKSAVVKWNRGD